MERKLVGKGLLSWPRNERISDRYGCVNLCNGPGEKSKPMSNDFTGKKGKLIAVITATRESHHIGDMFRGLGPKTPNVNDEFELGEGTVFYDEYNTIGLEPKEEREHDWLDPEKLYQCHDQDVELFFEEA